MVTTLVSFVGFVPSLFFLSGLRLRNLLTEITPSNPILDNNNHLLINHDDDDENDDPRDQHQHRPLRGSETDEEGIEAGIEACEDAPLLLQSPQLEHSAPETTQPRNCLRIMSEITLESPRFYEDF